MVIGKPAPFVSAFVEAIDAAIREHQPHHALSVTQRAWLAFCITAVLVTNSICWARFARASLGTSSLAALSWMFRQSKIPWDHLRVASVRGILRHHGLTSGSLVIDDTDPHGHVDAPNGRRAATWNPPSGPGPTSRSP